jgi:hypothetical protein
MEEKKVVKFFIEQFEFKIVFFYCYQKNLLSYFQIKMQKCFIVIHNCTCHSLDHYKYTKPVLYIYMCVCVCVCVCIQVCIRDCVE